jgi:hypothetical protein
MSAGGNKNALNRPVGPDGQRGWSYSLFGCFSACGLCTRMSFAFRMFCLLIARGFLARRLLRHLVPLHPLQQEQAAPPQSADPGHRPPRPP